MPNPEKNAADWLAWSLQFLLGIVAGVIVGAVLIFRTRVGFSMQAGSLAAFFCGGSLVGGALASYYGDRLWLGHSTRVIAPNSFRHSSASRMASMVTGSAGAALVVGPS